MKEADALLRHNVILPCRTPCIAVGTCVYVTLLVLTGEGYGGGEAVIDDCRQTAVVIIICVGDRLEAPPLNPPHAAVEAIMIERVEANRQERAQP